MSGRGLFTRRRHLFSFRTETETRTLSINYAAEHHPKTWPPVAVWQASLSDNMMVSDTTDAPTELTHMTQISPDLDSRSPDHDDLAQSRCLPMREPRAVLPDREHRPRSSPDRRGEGRMPSLRGHGDLPGMGHRVRSGRGSLGRNVRGRTACTQTTQCPRPPRQLSHKLNNTPLRWNSLGLINRRRPVIHTLWGLRRCPELFVPNETHPCRPRQSRERPDWMHCNDLCALLR